MDKETSSSKIGGRTPPPSPPTPPAYFAEFSSNDGPDSNNKIDSGDVQFRIATLTNALRIVNTQVGNANVKNIFQILIFLIASIVMLSYLICYEKEIADSNIDTTLNVGQVIFAIFKKSLIITTSFFIITFLLKLLKSYLHIYQRNSHRLMVINSMASLVESATESEREKIYDKLLDIIINFDKNGILKDEDQNTESADNEIILELIKKIPMKG